MTKISAFFFSGLLVFEVCGCKQILGFDDLEFPDEETETKSSDNKDIDTDTDADADTGLDTDTDVDTDADADVDTDIDADIDADTDTGKESCIHKSYLQCGSNGHVNWFDSCDKEGPVYDPCLACETCVNTNGKSAQCQASTVEFYLQCGTDGNVHWFDSCGVESYVLNDCKMFEHCIQISVDMAECQERAWSRIPAGIFWMGSPDGDCPSGYPGGSGTSCISESGRIATAGIEQLHLVSLTGSFELMRYEVTQGEFKEVMGWNPSFFSDSGSGATCGMDCPVESVSWFDSVAYANKVSIDADLNTCYTIEKIICADGFNLGTNSFGCMNSTRGGIDSATVTLNGVTTPYACTGYRLPTEAEWEYAIRAGSCTEFYPSEGNDGTNSGVGGCGPNSDSIAWYWCNSDTEFGHMTHQVGGKDANAWGLFDMSGNVEEWVWDWYAEFKAQSGIDPTGPASASYRVNRGGNWNRNDRFCRSASRNAWMPEYRSKDLGFRLARTLP